MSPRRSNDFEPALRWQLRALQHDALPARDLWPDIASALPQQPYSRQHRSWWIPVALAVSVLLVVGGIGWWHLPAAPVPAGTPMQRELVQREADNLSRQYQAALQELAPVVLPDMLSPTLTRLERDTALIHGALMQAPDSRLLLAQLHRTYAYRLALVQRVAAYR